MKPEGLSRIRHANGGYRVFDIDACPLLQRFFRLSVQMHNMWSQLAALVQETVTPYPRIETKDLFDQSKSVFFERTRFLLACGTIQIKQHC